MTRSKDSVASLRIDLATAKMLVWFASVGRDADLTTESHLYFFNRYRRLADCHRQLGHAERARRFERKADEHYRLAGGDGPPFAAAMAMARPARWIVVDVQSRQGLDGPGDAA
jgi:hypothetical protein